MSARDVRAAEPTDLGAVAVDAVGKIYVRTETAEDYDPPWFHGSDELEAGHYHWRDIPEPVVLHEGVGIRRSPSDAADEPVSSHGIAVLAETDFVLATTYLLRLMERGPDEVLTKRIEQQLGRLAMKRGRRR